MEKRHEDLYAKGELDGKSPEEQHSILNEYGYVMSSGKMVLLDKLLPKLRSEGHKVLIFSQFVKMLDLISDYCTFRDFRHERLDGRVRGTERQKAIDRFETEEDSFIFLLSTRAVRLDRLFHACCGFLTIVNILLTCSSTPCSASEGRRRNQSDRRGHMYHFRQVSICKHVLEHDLSPLFIAWQRLEPPKRRPGPGTLSPYRPNKRRHDLSTCDEPHL